jgi:hypothetical protein
MLIGANGTGKSSIAGAIAIGLGGSPNVSILKKKNSYTGLTIYPRLFLDSGAPIRHTRFRQERKEGRFR